MSEPRPLSRFLLWSGLLGVVAGIASVYTGAGLAALNLVVCKNQFSLTAANYHCSSPLYWIYAGYALIGVGVGAVIAFAAARLMKRRHQPVA